MEKSNSHLLVILTGLVVGAAAIILAAFGNPGNMGFCIACFIRDIAGGVKMHTAPVVQYVRPEIIGIVLGSMVMALIGGEFKAKGGSAPVSRFVLGFFVMVGALMFLGCPLRMVIRLGGGDGNALFGLLGFVLGVWVGTIFLGKGFTFKRAYNMPTLEGYALPAINVVLLVLLLMGAGVAAANAAAAKAAADAGTEAPEMAKTLLAFSLKGPGSMHAPIYIALIAGLVVGALAQKSRLCMAGGIRDAIMLKDLHLLWGFIAIFVAVLVGNFIRGKFGALSQSSPPSSWATSSAASLPGALTASRSPSTPWSAETSSGPCWACSWSALPPSCWVAARCASWSSPVPAAATPSWRSSV